MSAREQAVRVVARSMILSTVGDMLPPDTTWEVLRDHAFANDGAEVFEQVLGEAEAVVAALEAEMGLTEEDDVEWCDSETFCDYVDGGYWGKCNGIASHEGDHEHVDGWTWPRAADEPPKPRVYRLVTAWRPTPTEETDHG